MSTPNWKLEKVKELNDEVRELHPVLRELFRNMPNITHVNYTQGNRENGADFVLTKFDDVLMEEDYIGVIVKSTPIKQNHDDVKRQIKECELPRPAEGGKKSIYLTEVWIVTSKDITRNAQDFIHHEYKNTRIKFFDAEKLVKLLDKCYPSYWEFSNLNLNKYLTNQLRLIDDSEGLHALAPKKIGHIEIVQQIVKIPANSNRKFQRKPQRPVSLIDEINRNKFIFIEGGMGSGKSELLRGAAKKLCAEGSKLIPHFITFRELKESRLSMADLLASVERELDDITNKTIVIFIDGLDETAEEVEEKVKFLCGAATDLAEKTNVKLVITSRPIQQEDHESKLERYFDKYEVCPLSYGIMINFIEKLCDNMSVTAKFKDDLQNSALMKALPRTPLSAILLGRLLSENVKELPSTLPELYSKYTELVLGRWDLQKGNGSEKEYETVQRIIAIVAGYMIMNDLEFLGLGELEQIFKDYLGQRRTGQDASVLLKIFLSKHEIIGFDRERSSIFFKHKTFKEFFHATMQFQQKGLEAPIHKPFDLYWQGVEYFYLGIVRDAPRRISELSRIVPKDDLESLMKISSLANFLLAAYQTPYKEVESALEHSFKDAALLYTQIVYEKKDSWLRNLPELQLLCVMTRSLTQSYGYDFFMPALQEAKMQAEIDTELSDNLRNVMIFFIDSVLGYLGDESAFISLANEHESSLTWTLKLGIEFSAKDVGLINIATKKMSKKIIKASKGNRNFNTFILEIQDRPMKDRKDLPAQ